MGQLTKILIVCLMSFNSLAAVPTIEGLFRNGSNKDVTEDTIVFKFEIKKAETAINQNDFMEESETALPINKSFFGKIIFGLHREDRIEAIFSLYNDIQMKNEHLINSKYIKDWELMLKEDKFLERSLFYSILTEELLNKSTTVAAVLKKIDPNFKNNKELLNQEKLQLFKNYRNYLMAIKGDETLKETLSSPYKPENEEENEKVTALKKAEMYQRSGKVFLIREGNNFLWKAMLENFEAFFDVKEHRLQKLKWESMSGGYELNFHNYVLFNGVHMLPKFILLKDAKENVFMVKNLALQHFSNKSKTIKDRFKNYKELNKSNEVTAEIIGPIKEKFNLFILND